MLKPLEYRRFRDYAILLTMSCALAAGGIITMGCDPTISIPTGQLAPDQGEDVRRMDRTGIGFRLDSALEVARYQLPSMIMYGEQEVPITNWKSVSGDSVTGTTALIQNTFTGQQPYRSAVFYGEFTVPGSQPPVTKTTRFEIRVGWFL